MTHLTPEQIEELKQQLLNEKARLEDRLVGIGIKNPERKNDWNPVIDEAIDVSASDKNELADKFEDLEENTAIVYELEVQYREVDAALERIASGTYGIDENTGEPISLERLQANPAARTNI